MGLRHPVARYSHSVCCSVLQYVAVCSSVFQCVPCVPVCSSVFQSCALCCSMLQYVTLCCSVLQRVAESSSASTVKSRDLPPSPSLASVSIPFSLFFLLSFNFLPSFMVSLCLFFFFLLFSFFPFSFSLFLFRLLEE